MPQPGVCQRPFVVEAVVDQPLHEIPIWVFWRPRHEEDTMDQFLEEEFLAMPNFGSTSLQELRAKLTEYDLKLLAKTP